MCQNYSVTFVPYNQGYSCFIEYTDFVYNNKLDDSMLNFLAVIYADHINILRIHLNAIDAYKCIDMKLPAFVMWNFGDAILSMVEDFKMHNIEINGLYDHLTRDLGKKRMWLEKVVIFRRYMPSRVLLSLAIHWGQFSSAPKGACQKFINDLEGLHNE